MGLNAILQRLFGRRQPVFHKPESLSGNSPCLVSFPKCGRTWLRSILGHAISRAYALTEVDPLALTLFHSKDPRLPKIEIAHEDDPFNKRPEELGVDKSRYFGTRVAFLVRDPRDVFVSSYFEKLKRTGVQVRDASGRYDPKAPFVPYHGSMADFLKEEIGGFDTILRYFTVWYDQRARFARLELIRYEDLHADAAAQTRRVLDAFGVGGVSADDIAWAVNQSSFDKMHAAESRPGGSPRLQPGNRKDEESYKTRRGIVGGFRDYLSPEQEAELSIRMRAVLPAELGYV